MLPKRNAELNGLDLSVRYKCKLSGAKKKNKVSDKLNEGHKVRRENETDFFSNFQSLPPYYIYDLWLDQGYGLTSNGKEIDYCFWICFFSLPFDMLRRTLLHNLHASARAQKKHQVSLKCESQTTVQ